MNRRAALIVLAALGALGASGRGAAQRSSGVRRVGYLIASRGADFPALHGALRQGLSDLGYVDGRNLEIVVRSADGDASRYPALVRDLVEQRVDVIVASNSPAAVAASTGAPGTAVVFAGVGDPVGLSLVQSLARPGGNATGTVLLTPELTPKRLALLTEMAPATTRVAVLWNPGIGGQKRELADLDAMAQKLGVRVLPVEVAQADGLDAAFARMASQRADGLVVLASPLHHRNIRRIAELALRHGLPSICEFSEFAGAGGLMVYGPSWAQMYRHTATYVARILEGAKPAELPVEQPTQIDLVVNGKTAAALGLAIPEAIRLRGRIA